MLFLKSFELSRLVHTVVEINENVDGRESKDLDGFRFMFDAKVREANETPRVKCEPNSS
jgi:hypothetical protein